MDTDNHWGLETAGEGSNKELISKKYSLDVLNSAIWEDILNKPIFGEKNDDSE